MSWPAIIAAFFTGTFVGAASMAVSVFLFAGAKIRALDAQPNARLDRTEDNPRTQQSQGAVSVSHVGAALQQTKERNLG